MILLLLLVSFLIVAIVSWARLLYDSKRLNILGPFPIPLLGNALWFLGDSSHFIKAVNKIITNYGAASRAYILSSRYIVLAHPKYIEPLCSSTEFIFKDGSYKYLKPWLGEGLLTSSGKRWRTNRKLLTPAFHFNILQNFLPVFCKNEKILVKKIMGLAHGQPFDLFPIIALTALDNITETIMGVSINAQEDIDSNYVKSIEVISELISERMRNPFIWSDFCFNLFHKVKIDKALNILHGQTNKVVATRREELERNGITSLPPASDLGIRNKQAFLDLLLLSEVDGKKIDNITIREEVDTFMFEGHDTTTSGIVFCLYCISRNEDVQNKLFKEQKDIFGEHLNRDLEYSELQKMQYLELVIKESLRLYPSVPFIERYITRDSKIGELMVPKNTSLFIDILHMQRNPDVHEDPLTFCPERSENSGNKPFFWMYFSAGPRNCIGQKFAMMEMKVTLSAIIKKFKLLPSEMEPELCADLVLRSKNGVHVGFIPRE